MALTSVELGLWTPEAQAAPQLQSVMRAEFQRGTPDVNEAVGRNMELLRYLGGVSDATAEATEAELTTHFTALAAVGYDGRLAVEPATLSLPFEALYLAAEGKKPAEVAEAYRYPNLWTPGTEKKSYTQAELDGRRQQTVARLMVFSATESDFAVDEALHYLELPYDDYAEDKWNPDAETTQLAAFEADQTAFAAQHEGYALEAADHRSYLVQIALDRIAGIDPSSKEFFLNRGFMRVPAELGRRTVGGVSFVGDVRSSDGRAGFDGSLGHAYSGGGLGVLVGQTETA